MDRVYPRLDSSARSVLVVDDEISIRLMFSEFLRAHGYAVSTAGRVTEALSSLARRIPDAVILDVRMPGESGLVLLGRIRSNPRYRQLPVLLLTGSTLTQDEEALARQLGALVFYKPEHPDLILEMLRRLAPSLTSLGAPPDSVVLH